MSFLWYSWPTCWPACPHRLSLTSSWQDDGFGNCICTFDTPARYFVIGTLSEDFH